MTQKSQNASRHTEIEIGEGGFFFLMKKVNITNISNKIKFIYGDECEKNTVGIIIFSDGTDYFFDEKFNNKISNEEVEALLLRGAVVFKNGKYYKPASFDDENVSFGGGAVVNPEDIEVDLSDYATNSSVDEKIANIKVTSLVGNTLTFGNYAITYNETDDTLDFIYNGVIEEPVVSDYVSEGLSLYIDASDVATYGSIRDLTENQTITNNGASITSDNKYLNFVDSESDYIETGLAPNLTQWSVETYFYFTTTPTTTQMLIAWGGSGSGVRIGFREDNNAFIVRLNSSINYEVGNISNFTSLCHLIITMDKGTVTSYINGVKTVLGSNANSVQTSQAETLKIGASYKIDQFTNMNLKSFRFYNGKVLSDEEALQNYNYEINRNIITPTWI